MCRPLTNNASGQNRGWVSDMICSASLQKKLTSCALPAYKRKAYLQVELERKRAIIQLQKLKLNRIEGITPPEICICVCGVLSEIFEKLYAELIPRPLCTCYIKGNANLYWKRVKNLWQSLNEKNCVQSCHCLRFLKKI